MMSQTLSHPDTITSLPHHLLTTLTLEVDFPATVVIGTTPHGHRGIARVAGGHFAGERLSGSVRPGHDWYVVRADGTLEIDVRLTLATDDGAAIYLSYQGNMRAAPEVMARFRKGERLAPEDYALQVVATMECGDARYGWLNDLLVVGIGEQMPGGVIYRLFEIGA
uniref:DUF3237 domain-containing protein n=1 Tax=Sphingomonas sp. TaxID=28214 RepID=UPI0025F5502A|nr:DUF3237 domain-containing protein [Sphingomonas sp.]